MYGLHSIGWFLSYIFFPIDLASMLIHLPSILALGLDENLERWGSFITTLGWITDLLIVSAVTTFLFEKYRTKPVLRPLYLIVIGLLFLVSALLGRLRAGTSFVLIDAMLFLGLGSLWALSKKRWLIEVPPLSVPAIMLGSS